MTFGQLTTFLALARTGSVRGAAAELVVTEPAVSAAVGALQKSLGAELVARRGRGVVLTPAGETLARYAAELIGLRDQARRAVRTARTLRLAAVTTAAEYVVPPLLKAFRAERPDIEVSLEVGNRSVVFERLLHREVDLAVGGRPPAGSGISGVPFLNYRLVVVGTPGAEVIDPEAETWLLREQGSGTRATVEAFLEDNGISPRSVMTLGSNGAIKQAAAVGLGVSLISTHAAGLELATGTLRRLPVAGAPLRRSWFVLRREGGPELPEAAAFEEFCRSRPARAAVLTGVRRPPLRADPSRPGGRPPYPS